MVFPFRPLSIFSRNKSPATQTTYWLREHTSKRHLPIVLIQGIGVGLYAYVDFLIALSRNGDVDTDQSDEEIGIMVVEIMPISARICPGALTTTEMRDDIRKLLDAHGWDEVVLIGHSYVNNVDKRMYNRNQMLTLRLAGTDQQLQPISCATLHCRSV